MDYQTNLSQSDQHWLDLIQQCRTSGKSDNQWLLENNIKSPTFYYHVKQLRKKACEIPPANRSGSNDRQEVVPLIIEETAPVPVTTESVPVSAGDNSIAIRLNIKGVSIEIANNATQEVIKNTMAALQLLC